MQQMYSCPNCNAPLVYGQNMCTNCGARFNWNIPQPPPPSPQYQSSRYQYPGQQQNVYENEGSLRQKRSSGGIVALIVVLLIAATIGGVNFATNGAILKWFTSPVVAYFDASSPAITSGEQVKLQWEVTGATGVSITPDIGTVSSSGTVAVSPTATTTYTLVATNFSGSAQKSTIITVTVPGKPSISNFTFNPGTINSGGSATLSWDVAGATSVSISPSIGTVSGSGSQTVTPDTTTTYTITASNGTGPSTTSATITVTPAALPVVSNFTANPTAVASGEASTLSWGVTGATSVSISPDIGSVSSTGTKTVSSTSTTVYTLTATNGTGNTTGSVTVTVNTAGKPVITTFTADVTSITAGEAATLTWDVRGATSVSISPDIGTVASIGTKTVSPTSATTYILTATNSYGSNTVSVTITVTAADSPVISSFYASPSTVTSGSAITLQWTVTGATSVSITPGIGTVSLTGSATANPTATTTYILTATGSSGSVTASATVTVGTITNAPVINSFNASPIAISSGQSTTLSWAVTGATSISISPTIGTVSASALSGSATAIPAATTTYVLTATNSYGSITASAAVTVSTTAGSAPVIRSFTASPGSIASGGTSTLTWNIQGATSISIDQDIGIPASTYGQEVSPTATTTYTLTAFNSSGSATATTTVTVTP